MRGLINFIMGTAMFFSVLLGLAAGWWFPTGFLMIIWVIVTINMERKMAKYRRGKKY